jgi:hypothetical protein
VLQQCRWRLQYYPEIASRQLIIPLSIADTTNKKNTAHWSVADEVGYVGGKGEEGLQGQSGNKGSTALTRFVGGRLSYALSKYTVSHFLLFNLATELLGCDSQMSWWMQYKGAF